MNVYCEIILDCIREAAEWIVKLNNNNNNRHDMPPFMNFHFIDIICKGDRDMNRPPGPNRYPSANGGNRYPTPDRYPMPAPAPAQPGYRPEYSYSYGRSIKTSYFI